MTIQHLVISGGANIGFPFFGIIKTLLDEAFFTMNNIKTIYCTSIGTLIAVLLTIQYDMETMRIFMTDRPWDQVYKVDFHSIVRAIQEGGMFDKRTIINTMKPLLLGNDLSLDITLEEYYAYCQKEIHFFTTEYATLELVDISHKTHPHWKLVDAVYASSCLPVLMDPFFIDGHYYIDGGVLKNYPLKQCIDAGADPNTILGLFHNTNKLNKALRMASPFTENPSSYRLFEYLYSFTMKMWTLIKHHKTQEEESVPYQIPVECDTSFLRLLETFQSKALRNDLIEDGIAQAHLFLERQKEKRELIRMTEEDC